MLCQRPLDCYRSLDRYRGILEGDEESVAGLFHLRAAKAVEDHPRGLIMPADQFLPGVVAEYFYERC